MKAKNDLLDPAVSTAVREHQVLFNEQEVLAELKHYLPAQAPLKDFIHHNTLHAFQHYKFFDALRTASSMLGYKTSLTLGEYRSLYHAQKIRSDVLKKVIESRAGKEGLAWMDKVLTKEYSISVPPKIGMLRSNWKKHYRIDLDSLVHPLLFRIICSYLDQGISIWNFPVWHKGFLPSLRELERNSFISIFKTSRARKFLLEGLCSIGSLLKILVGDKSLYKQYLFDQQFAHQGWSGMVSSVEANPDTLLDRKNITLHDLIVFELLLEIDSLDHQFGETWLPLASRITNTPANLFAEIPETELSQVLAIWQEAFEWSYFDEVLAAIQHNTTIDHVPVHKTFQAMFCIDDREESLRRYLEKLDTHCETFGTPGFFGVEFFFKPVHGKFYTKLCPAPITPGFLIKEVGVGRRHRKDVHFKKHTHTLFRGWLHAQVLGFWSALKLFSNIFRPAMSAAMASSFNHMDEIAKLTIESKNPEHRENDLQVGFTIEEMIVRVESLLKSIGLVRDFAPLVYVIGHGSSSINNPHYAAYDCGACSGRPGSVNARVFCYMANHKDVRAALRLRDIHIPDETQFVGGLHDTSRDEIEFYDADTLSSRNEQLHRTHTRSFEQALALNAKERSRRFELTKSTLLPSIVHRAIKLRSVSLFEPRPELNHATNALCVIGRRAVLTRNLFLDRRAFHNSYDYRLDPKGDHLFKILKAAAPVCGGINLEYFFSRVDNHKLGAGTKLPHNVMGLFGVANGIDGDLRPGLPGQMIEVHDPLRLMMIVEHNPDVVLHTIQRAHETLEWFSNEWIHLIVIEPETKKLYRFANGKFIPYTPCSEGVKEINDLNSVIETQQDNLPVYKII